ncbi:MAG: ImmA/IrrE family metallo-endopeptidase [Gammaproteobacteria bacterium]|nr:ImmA/IrrE family metallo-endopeptidase [Gammaproteobacteria bacterium]MDE0443930.1 ImmA/IrrE family metallo-endopeptidase [Gammaproteobacteria bacterium]
MLKKQYIDVDRIEAIAKQWRVAVKNERNSLVPEDPVDLLDPKILAEVVRVQLEYHAELPSDVPGFEVAGLLDRELKLICLSEKFKPEEVRFTTLHEIGHWLMHQDLIKHRDRPISHHGNGRVSLPVEEREANRFAAAYSMPPHGVERRLETTFGLKTPIRITNDLAFLLQRGKPDTALRRGTDGLLKWELAIAGCESIGGPRFVSMKDQFRVSATAMAIRLRELGLVRPD